MNKITVLGMGSMGSRIAMNLVKAKYEVTVWNRNLEKAIPLEQAGAKVAQTPYDAAQNAEFVISMVRDDEASKEVWLSANGALRGMNQNAIAIESSTLTLEWTKNLANQFKQHKIAFLDAPVAGTRPQAETAQLIYFVGGDAIALEKAKPIFQTLGKKTHHIGTVGSGMGIKLAVNTLFAIQVSAWGELIYLLKQTNLDVAQACEIIAQTPVCSPSGKVAAQAMIKQQFAPLFPIELVNKDLNYALAHTKGMQLPLILATEKIYESAIAQGFGEDNITGILQLY